ncbi:MAG TPA: class I SAM-dependent methyltransferase [Patescibacteria group bacterium]|nr:class I SAM-dependent methyltransferase [Patescibacteria group bacterium]
MTSPTQTLLDRASSFFGDDVTWMLPDALAPLRRFRKFQAVHPVRPGYLALKNMGVAVTPDWPEEKSQSVAISLPRQAEWACGLMAQALERLPAGGHLLTIAHNDLGGRKYAKLLEENFEVLFADSKNHCRATVVARPAQLPAIVATWRAQYQPQPVAGAEMTSLPGNFSHARVDTGSALLHKHLPPLAGRVADFGGGWGYLAEKLAHTAKVDLYESDWNALQMAHQNLRGKSVEFFWHDILAEPIAAKYDAVVMNPPFHDMKDASPDIGRGFIEKAAAALKKPGQLWLVANIHLPYEEVLNANFGSFRQVARDRGFKVLTASR